MTTLVALPALPHKNSGTAALTVPGHSFTKVRMGLAQGQGLAECVGAASPVSAATWLLLGPDADEHLWRLLRLRAPWASVGLVGPSAHHFLGQLCVRYWRLLLVCIL
jgi:hypothetical protein